MDKTIVSEYIKPLAPEKTDMAPKGRLDRNIRAILFDVYGTLFISASGGGGPADLDPERRLFLQSLLLKYDQQMSPESILTDLRKEIAAQHSAKRAQGIDFPEVDILHVWGQLLPMTTQEDIRRFALEFEFIVNPVYPMPGLGRFLAACARQIPVMGIISNAQFYTPLLFEWMLGADLSQLGFDPELVMLSHRFGQAKPSTALFQHAAVVLEKRGIRPSETLYVGNDMLKDICPAGRCGFRTALFAGDKRSLRLHQDAPRCRQTEPDLIITELEQLLPSIMTSDVTGDQ